MNTRSQPVFRDSAVDRLSSPDQLDQLVQITRPADWLAALVIALGLVALIAWGVVGRIHTSVAGDGILIGDHSKSVDAAATFGGRLSSIDVAVGDTVAPGQTVAVLTQADSQARHAAALAVLGERQREYADLIAATQRELAVKSASFAARRTGLQQEIAAAGERAVVLAGDVDTLQGMISRGLTTQPELEQARANLYAARQSVTDARHEMLALQAEQQDLETQRTRDRLAAQFRVDEARRDADQSGEALERETRILSPVAGRVTEIKVSLGAVLGVGTPVAAIATSGARLQAIIYLPAETGKTVRPGMEVRVQPASVQRDEYGTIIGKVLTVAEFPATGEGMASDLHNDELVRRFVQTGALYRTTVQLLARPGDAGAYRWSSGRGPPLQITPGTLAHAEVFTRERHPWELILPLVRRVSGRQG